MTGRLETDFRCGFVIRKGRYSGHWEEKGGREGFDAAAAATTTSIITTTTTTDEVQKQDIELQKVFAVELSVWEMEMCFFFFGLVFFFSDHIDCLWMMMLSARVYTWHFLFLFSFAFAFALLCLDTSLGSE